MMNGIGWGMSPGGWLWMIGTAGLIALLVWLALGSVGHGPGERDEAAEILRARLARGEIGPDEFERSLAVLGPHPGSARRWRGRVALIGAVLLVLTFGAAALAASGLSWSVDGTWGPAGMMGQGGMMGSMMGGARPWGVTAAPGGESGAPAIGMQGDRFGPSTLTVKAGTTVTWINDDDAPHTVTAVDRSWSSGDLPPGTRYQRAFTTPGTYAYICLYHPWMQGTVIVQP